MSSEQIVRLVLAISGVGLTVTVTLKVPPEQEDATIGVTTYSTVCTLVVRFLKAWLIEDCGVV